MTDSSYTHIVFLLDRSGSMQSIKSDTEGGFDAFIAAQGEQPGRCTVTLAQFDTEYQVVYEGRPLAAVPPLVLEPRGGTALLDSIGRLIRDTGRTLEAMAEEQRPGVVEINIMTDGLENSSREYTRQAIKVLIEEQEREYNWTFSYMGANQDAIEVGAGMGIPAERNLTYGTGGGDVLAAMGAKARATSRLRNAVAHGATPAAARAAMAYADEDRVAAAGSSKAKDRPTRAARSRPVQPEEPAV